MTKIARDPLYRRDRFPAEVIAHAVWLYFRFPLSLRMVEDMLAARGIVVSHQKSRVISGTANELNTTDILIPLIERKTVMLGNPMEIQQIIMKLCKNAAEALRDIGEIQVQVDRVENFTKRVLSHGELAAGATFCCRCIRQRTGYSRDRYVAYF